VPDSEITTAILREIRDEIVGLRSDNVQLKDEVSATRTELKGELSAVRTELKGELSAVRTELKGELSAVRTELKAELVALRQELVGMLGELTDKVEALGRYAKNITRRVDKAIEELRERIAKLEARRKN
jgi:uncharacterized protein involved in exopolysaccharide biosynthesis